MCDTNKYNCPDCDQTFNTSPQLSQHRKDKDHTFNVNHAARLFHDRYATQPPKDAAFRAFDEVVKKIGEALMAQGLINRMEFVGSAYEGTAVAAISDYDVLYIKSDLHMVPNTLGAPVGYALLTKDGIQLRAKEERDTFRGKIHKIINNKDFSRHKLILKDHGPAIQLDISADGAQCSVDLVCTREVASKITYVAKAPKGSTLTQPQKDTFWYQSSSLESKAKLRTADDGNYCRKEAYRMVKVIRNREQSMGHMASFQIKTALFNVMDRKPNNRDWERSMLGDRTLDVLRELAQAYGKGKLPHYFIPKLDLLASTNDATKKNTAARLENLIKKPTELFKVTG